MINANQHSRLDLFCTGIMEACWLTAAIIVPVFFNLYSSRIFEPDKVALVHSLAVIMACAWFVRFMERREPFRQYVTVTLRNPVVLSAIAFVAINLIATLTSVAPDLSLFGSYGRMQGAYTTLCYMIFFFIILLEMRTHRQIDRLFMAIIMGSVPLALYAIMQRLNMDPLMWNFDMANRTPSTMGNPIFTGAYLCMVSVLTLGRLASDLLEIKRSQTSLPDIARVAGYGLIALLQIFALFSSDSRGPWVGWLAGVFFFALLLVVMSRRRRLIIGVMIAGILGMAFLLALNLAGSPLAGFRNAPYLSSFGRLFEAESGTGKIRTLIWEGNIRLVLAKGPIQYPDGGKDSLNIIRPFLGYGPETMALIYSQFYPPELTHVEYRTRLIDRSHNEIWDTLVTTGLLGLIGYQSLLVCLFLFGMQRIGLIANGRERGVFIGSWAGLGAAGGFIAIALNQAKFVALGLALGTVAGVILFIVMTVMRLSSREQNHRLGNGNRVLIASILAAMLGHYVEVQFGISVAGTQTLFWIAAGALVAIGLEALRTDDSVPSFNESAQPQVCISETKTPERKRGDFTDPCPSRATGFSTPFLRQSMKVGLGYSLITALILVVLFYEFIHNHQRFHDPLVILWRSLAFAVHPKQSAYTALGLLAAAWILCSFTGACELYRCRPFKSARGWIVALALISSSSMGMAFFFALSLAGKLKNLVTSAVTESITVSERLIGIYDAFCLTFFLAVLLVGLALAHEKKRPFGLVRRPWAALLLLPPVLFGGYVWINSSNLDPIRADIMIREGGIHQSRNRHDDAVAHFRRAVELWPSDICYSKLGGGLVAQSSSADPAAASRLNESTRLSDILLLDARKMQNLSRSDLFHAATVVLTHAVELNPLYSDHMNNLTRVYRRWTSLTTDSKERARLADRTMAFYKQATTISPHDVILWNEWASFHLDEKGDVDSALQTVEKSFALDSEFSHTYLVAGNIYLRQKNWGRSAESFNKALSLTPDLAEAYDRLAYIFYEQGKYRESINANRNVLRIMAGTPTIWKTHQNLAILHSRIGDLQSALTHIEQAIEAAPAENRQEMAAFRATIFARIPAAAKSSSALR